LPERFTQAAQFARPENDQDDDQNNDQMTWLKRAQAHK